MHEKPIAISAFDQVSVYQEPVCNDGSTIEDLIASFLKAKFARTQSTKTAKAYVETLHGFRRYLREQGLDLIANLKGKSADEVNHFRVQIAEAARDYAILSVRPGKFVAKSTETNGLPSSVVFMCMLPRTSKSRLLLIGNICIKSLPTRIFLSGPLLSIGYLFRPGRPRREYVL